MQDNINNEIENEGGLSVLDILYIGLNNWYWFVLSTAICLILGFFYAKSVDQIYRTEALILIKSDDSKKGGILSESTLFADMGLGGSGTVVENEIYILRSTPLIKTTISRLNLDITYSVKEYLRNVDVYTQSPIEVCFVDKELMRGATIKINLLSDLEYSYVYKNSEGEEVIEGNSTFDKEEVISAGRFIVKKTPAYSTDLLDKTITVKLYDIEKRVKCILKNLSVSRADKITGIIRLTLNDFNLNRANDILNTLIAVYNENVIDDKNRVATNTEKFIVERISTISKDLGGIDGQIERLKKDNKIVDFVSSSGNLVQLGSKYKEEVIAVETEISLIKFIRDYLLDPTKKNELIPTNTGISDIGIESQITKYNEERLRLDKMMINSGVNNPVTKDLINTLNVIKANMIHSINNFLSSLEIKKEQLINQESIANRRIEAVPTQEKLVNDIVRQQKIKESLYLYLLNKREENALNLAITESNAKIVEEARGDDIPISPSMMMYLIISAILGILIPVGVLFVVSLLDSKVHDKRDIEKYTTIPVIGEIPQKRKDQRDGEVLITETGRDRISEAFRIVRSNMDFLPSSKDGLGKVVQLTSTMPGEGKTYATINLALSYAHTGNRVLVIDLDLRKGKMSKLIDAKNHFGMSSYLSGKTSSFDDITTRGIKHANLDFISTGPIPPNPANLLMSDVFKNMISELRNNYDYIFMDTVPALMIADAVLVNRIADITLYVMRNSMVDKNYLKEIEKMYRANKFTNMLILLTDVDIRVQKYGYGYGYGYLDREEDKRKTK